ncbi:hypothetical protein FHS57_005571 [Runella defluvii]|uniref:Reverse transcriptase domain-containing protein n=1 Tax=Runella defluvii TaxID=370973 RepID=A0A7W6ETB5_9BACT|nr:RNA-directed DNA polymerase [Runella defluvii]MBB3841543.1 hypothetical protein [Runella defluvii]
MNLIKLISKGYFPAELPPPFNTELLGVEALNMFNYFQALNNSVKKDFKETINLAYSVPKFGLSRRLMGIPNPIHQIDLSKIVCDNWIEIQALYGRSSISSSKQIEDETGKRATKMIDSFGEFKEKCLEQSFDKLFELKVDISKYFSTIYTHSIPWAIHSKTVAKQNKNDFTLLGNLLDKAIRNAQSGQTIGIPIGPDTSRIISEILGCTFDKLLTDKFKLVGFRYVDDCYFYFDSQSNAEHLFKHFQTILTEYGLDINEEKTSIKKQPFPYESKWVIELSNYQIRKNLKGQITDLKNYVSFALELVTNHPKDSVLKFAIKKLFYDRIYKSNWNLFESLIFRMGISEPVILPEILKLLLTYENWVNKSKLKKFLYSIISEHIYKGHNFEVSWALWIAKTFSIKISKPLAQQIFDSRDSISILICFDMMQRKLITDKINLDSIESEVNESSFINEWWLLTYEGIVKKWIEPNPADLLAKNKYFSELKKKKIEFYDTNRQISKIEFRKPKPQAKPIEIDKLEYGHSEASGSSTEKKIVVVEY